MGTMSEPSVPSPLIDVADLAAETASGTPPVLLDVRWTLTGSDRGGYLAGHLPGAVFVDLDRDLAATPGLGGRHPLPEPQVLQQVWRAAGIENESHVVVYDGGNGVAARAWWLLRWSGLATVHVLDGGFPAWTTVPDRPIERGAPPPSAAGSMTVVPGGMPVVDADEAAAMAEARESVLLDARAGERFRGEIEPVDPIPGHIPGSVNLPATGLLGRDGRYRPAREIAETFAALGIGGPDGPTGSAARPAPRVAASCGSGVTACQLILAGRLAGVELALYPGSYSQWCALGRPVAVG